jgi:L-ornithine N5-oxygenase
MYDQQVDRDIAGRGGNALPLTGARITIRNYSNVSSAKISAHPLQTSTETNTLSVVFQNTLTQDLSETTYDAIVCATGYERNSWLNLLKASSLGKHFGLCATSSDKTCLSVDRDFGMAANKNGDCAIPMNGKNGIFKVAANGRNGHSQTSDMRNNAGPGIHAPYIPMENKISGTPPTSRVTGEVLTSMTDTLYISRRYKLLPLPTADHKFIPKIYLQGCAEETHGLSETLLSVMGIRAGEMVEDLCSNY